MFLADVTPMMCKGIRLKHRERERLLVTVMIRDSDRGTNNSARNLVEVMLFQNWGLPQARSAGRISDPMLLPFSGPGMLVQGTEIETVNGETSEHRQVWHVIPRAHYDDDDD